MFDLLQFLASLLDYRMWVTILIVLAHTLPALGHQGMMFFIKEAKLFEHLIIQPNPRSPVSSELRSKLWRAALITHCVQFPLLVWLFHPFVLGESTIQAIPARFDLGEMPTLAEFLPHLLVCILLEDAAFYWCHRLLHTPWLYARIHKQHHEFKTLTSYSLASEYTHAIESILGNLVPVLLGPIVLRGHFKFTSFLMWVVVRMFKSCDSHCGYRFEWSPFDVCWPLNSTVKHDFHHESGFGGCFGSFFVFWDSICGTDKSYYRDKELKKSNDRRQMEQRLCLWYNCAMWYVAVLFAFNVVYRGDTKKTVFPATDER